MQNVGFLTSRNLPHVKHIAAQIATNEDEIAIRAQYKRIALKKNGSIGIETKCEIWIEYTGSNFIEVQELDRKMSARPKADLLDAIKPLALHYCVAMCKIDRRYYQSIYNAHFVGASELPSVYCGVEQKHHGDFEMETFDNCHVLGLQFKGDEVVIEVLWGDLSGNKEAAEKSTPIGEDYPYYVDLQATCELIVLLAHKYNFMGEYELEGIKLEIPNAKEDE